MPRGGKRVPLPARLQLLVQGTTAQWRRDLNYLQQREESDVTFHLAAAVDIRPLQDTHQNRHAAAQSWHQRTIGALAPTRVAARHAAVMRIEAIQSGTARRRIRKDLAVRGITRAQPPSTQRRQCFRVRMKKQSEAQVRCGMIVKQIDDRCVAGEKEKRKQYRTWIGTGARVCRIETYPDAPSVVMMGLRVSFFLFLAIMLLAPLGPSPAVVAGDARGGFWPSVGWFPFMAGELTFVDSRGRRLAR